MPADKEVRPLASPWKEFLTELDGMLDEPLELHCIGGFVFTYFYALSRTTGDIDYYTAIPVMPSAPGAVILNLPAHSNITVIPMLQTRKGIFRSATIAAIFVRTLFACYSSADVVSVIKGLLHVMIHRCQILKADLKVAFCDHDSPSSYIFLASGYPSKNFAQFSARDKRNSPRSFISRMYSRARDYRSRRAHTQDVSALPMPTRFPSTSMSTKV